MEFNKETSDQITKLGQQYLSDLAKILSEHFNINIPDNTDDIVNENATDIITIGSWICGNGIIRSQFGRVAKITETGYVVDNTIELDREYEEWGDAVELMTDEEIEKHLTFLLNTRGYKEGIKYKSSGNDSLIGTCKGKLEYNHDVVYYTEGEGYIFRDGIWAEIINIDQQD